jgi:hypothetical protein
VYSSHLLANGYSPKSVAKKWSFLTGDMNRFGCGRRYSYKRWSRTWDTCDEEVRFCGHSELARTDQGTNPYLLVIIDTHLTMHSFVI